MIDLENVRRDIQRLSSDLSKGLAATTVLIQQAQQQLSDLSRRLEEKVQRDHERDIRLAGELSEIKTKLERSKEWDELIEKVTKIEAVFEVKADITGRHSTAQAEEERRLENKKIEHEARREKLRFWGVVIAVALPGLFALIWQVLGLQGDPPPVHPPPMLPSAGQEPPSSDPQIGPPRHE